jgi:hypothetical protein
MLPKKQPMRIDSPFALNELIRKSPKPLIFSNESLAAIERLNSGKGIHISLKEKLEHFIKIRHTKELEGVLNILAREAKAAKLRGAVSAIQDEQFFSDINYEEKETKIIENLTELEYIEYWNNLIQLKGGHKLFNRFRDHELEDKSNSSGKYTQNLRGYRLFLVRRDLGYNRRRKRNPSEKSRAIQCLYFRKNDTVMLCNIAEHDDVYTENPDSYEPSL